MTNLRTPFLSLSDRCAFRPHLVRRVAPSVSIALLALLGTTACGSADADAGADAGASGSSDVAAAVGELADEGTGGGGTEAPDACSLLTLEEIKTATGRTFAPGEGTDYDNSCTFDTDSERITVSVSDFGDLESAAAIGIDVAPVAGLPGATRVDAMVYVEKDGLYLTVGTGLPGFSAPELDVAAAEELARIAADRL